MASALERSTQQTKQLLLGCGVILLGIMAYYIIAKILEQKPATNNNTAEVATLGFGALPDVIMETLPLSDNAAPTFSLETPDGKLPTTSLATIVNVYKFKRPRESLTALEEGTKLAEKFAFKKTPAISEQNPNIITWTNQDKQQVFVYNKLQEDFYIQTDYAKADYAKKGYEVSAVIDDHKKKSKEILADTKLLSKELREGEQVVDFLILTTENRYSRASSASKADLVRSDLFYYKEGVTPIFPAKVSDEQKEKLEQKRRAYKVVTSTPDQSLIFTVLGGEKDILEAQFVYWPTEDDTETYNLISLSDAWQKIQDGEGYLRSLYLDISDPYVPYEPMDVEKFNVKEISIAYYLTPEYQEYLQPIYVFSGEAKVKDNKEKAKFTFYLPAVKK